jgi:hypothetical protein
MIYYEIGICDELEGNWMEVVVTESGYYSSICLEEVKKATEGVSQDS